MFCAVLMHFLLSDISPVRIFLCDLLHFYWPSCTGSYSVLPYLGAICSCLWILFSDPSMQEWLLTTTQYACFGNSLLSKTSLKVSYMIGPSFNYIPMFFYINEMFTHHFFLSHFNLFVITLLHHFIILLVHISLLYSCHGFLWFEPRLNVRHGYSWWSDSQSALANTQLFRRLPITLLLTNM